MDDFIKFPKIENIKKIHMSITEKIHGTNAQILIRDGRSEAQWAINAGLRTRWLTPEDDNYGFCKWVYDNKESLINLLGEGRHYGEWFGQGINNGYGLKEKKFALFDWRRWHKMPLPESVVTVPVLYTGDFNKLAVNAVMERLKQTGSILIPGYMKPEGLVIEIGNDFYKAVFAEEDVKWKKPDVLRAQLPIVDCDNLLQPIRLEKLLSRDERYVRNYPESLKEIASAYYDDLIAEQQIVGDADEIRAIKKSLGRVLFQFIKSEMERTGV